MYEHQIIDGLNIIIKKFNLKKKTTKDKEFFKTDEYLRFEKLINISKELIKKIKQSQKFHINFQLDSILPDGEKTFLEGPSSTVRLPYNSCFFDWNINTTNELKFKFKYTNADSRRAMLCEEVCPDIIACYLFHFINEYNEWILCPTIDLIYINDTFNNIKSNKLNKIKKYFGKYDFNINFDLQRHNILSISIVKMTREEIIEMGKSTSDCLTILSEVLVLLTCKNIGLEKVEPDQKLNKKRLRNKKQPIMTYKTLVIKPINKKQRSIPLNLWNNRIHLARGHFKTYTEDAPLFGKVIGRFWWQPQARGKNKKGMVVKDYIVEK